MDFIRTFFVSEDSFGRGVEKEERMRFDAVPSSLYSREDYDKGTITQSSSVTFGFIVMQPKFHIFKMSLVSMILVTRRFVKIAKF